MKAFITGHRVISKSAIAQLDRLIDIAIEHGANHFFNGMAIGTDQEFAEVLIQRKLDWTAVIPCVNQGRFWSLEQKARYEKILLHAPEKITLATDYYPGCMQARNKYMANNSNICLAVYDGRLTGGTAGTVKMAIAKGLPIIQLHPVTLQISTIEPATQLSLL
ncbi:SLOG family protein [Anabaena azotica]|uniref:DUF1273 family protein n=1 Tax=Anabaena azotica FACHB-119 TaxID=947527 RepID=A0ABR8CYY3_9NOST|nr:SLOG family protein [Anabaena azotica]MBD2499872.1 DUF1273 family protein [Anabaena azotica FACHB-119]